jgi:hypothetical protein
MKKIIIAAVILLILAGSFYVFIPNIIVLKNSVAIPASQKGLHRMLVNKKNIINWWPGTVSKDSFYLNGYKYQIYDNSVSLLPIIIENKEGSIKSTLFLLSPQTDSVSLEWVASTASSYNPLKRFSAYLKARQLSNDMNTILEKMQKYFSVSENIYGCDIKKELVVDANLISTSGKCKGYPSTEFVYSLISKLEGYANIQNTKITGYPMLNTEQADSANYFVRVALPLENVIPSDGDIQQKRMLKNGNILVTEVKGGNLKASEAFNQIIQYADDYNRISPAIPFYSLITDRTKEPDSTKWITKVYYPVR